MIIAPYYDLATGNLSVWTTSDLWEAVNGTATLVWYDWEGNELPVNTSSPVNFSVGAINSTQVLQTNVTETLKDYDLTNAILHMSVEAEGTLPNSNISTTFRHDNWFHPTALKDAQLVDPARHHGHGARAAAP